MGIKQSSPRFPTRQLCGNCGFDHSLQSTPFYGSSITPCNLYSVYHQDESARSITVLFTRGLFVDDARVAHVWLTCADFQWVQYWANAAQEIVSNKISSINWIKTWFAWRVSRLAHMGSVRSSSCVYFSVVHSRIFGKFIIFFMNLSSGVTGLFSGNLSLISPWEGKNGWRLKTLKKLKKKRRKKKVE